MQAIWTAIAQQYFERGWIQFWPRQFVTPESPEHEVLVALKTLVGMGRLEDELVLFCPDGHRAWIGPTEELAEHLGSPCPEPDCGLEGEGEAELRFIVTDRAREDLEAARAALRTAEKKSPSAP